ncbi:MAG: pentapeptide repeat-containing protein, partial [Mucilaginibacter sp.]
MEQKFDENTIYRNLKPSDLEGRDRIFEDCKFINCDLSYANLSRITFINCEMDTCNLSLIKITDAGFQSVDFKDCKITGV